MSKEAKEAQTDKAAIPAFVYVLFGSSIVGLVMALALLLTNRATPAIPVTDTSAQFRPVVAVGESAPDFEALTLDGTSVKLSDYRGQVVFLNFWATWCVPCQREMPGFDAYMQRDGRNGVILAVNNGEPVSVISRWLDENSIQHVPILLDEDFGISDMYVALNLPITYVIDAEGVVRTFKFGEMTLGDIDSYLTSLQSG